MKKLLCLALAILTALTAVTVFADASNVSMAEGVRLSYDGVFYDEYQSGEGTINVTLQNSGAADKITFVVAEYTEDAGYRKLVQSKIQTLEIGANEKKKFEVKFTPNDAAADSFNIFAFTATNAGSIYLGNEFVLDKFQYIGTEEDGASIYKINSFTDRVYDKFKYVSTEEDGTTVYRIDRFRN